MKRPSNRKPSSQTHTLTKRGYKGTSETSRWMLFFRDPWGNKVGKWNGKTVRLFHGWPRHKWQEKLRKIQHRPANFTYDLWYETNIDMDEWYTVNEATKLYIKVRGYYITPYGRSMLYDMRAFLLNKRPTGLDKELVQLPYEKENNVRFINGGQILIYLQTLIRNVPFEYKSIYRKPPIARSRRMMPGIFDIIAALKKNEVPYPQEEDILLSSLTKQALKEIYHRHEPHKYIGFTSVHDKNWQNLRKQKYVANPLYKKRNKKNMEKSVYKAHNPIYTPEYYQQEREKLKEREQFIQERRANGGITDDDIIGTQTDMDYPIDTAYSVPHDIRRTETLQDLIEEYEQYYANRTNDEQHRRTE